MHITASVYISVAVFEFLELKIGKRAKLRIVSRNFFS